MSISKQCQNNDVVILLHKNVWKINEKTIICFGNSRKRKENTRCEWKPMENARNTQVLRGNLWKT